MKLHPVRTLSTLLLLCPLFVQAQDSIRIEGAIEAATVFFSGAELTIEGEADLKKGRNVLVFEGLTSSLERSSIQLEGGKGLRIRSVEKGLTHRGMEKEIQKKLRSKKDSLEQVEFKLSQRKSMKKVYDEERGMILENKNIKGKQQGVDVEDLMELAIYYRKRLKDIEYKLIEVKDAIEELREEKRGLKERIRNLERTGKERVSKIVVSIEAERSGKEELKLSYFSPRAGWKPAYELNCPSLGEPVRLTYKGEVWQRTGRDWENIDLTLASGKPTRSGDRPEMEPWRLQFEKKYRNRGYMSKGGQAKKKQQRQVQGKKSGQLPQRQKAENMENAAGELAEEEEEEATPDPGAVHTRFPIESAYDVSSGRSSRSVTIKELKIDAEHDHLALPKYEQEAFLIAKLSGWEATDLFPGQASVQYAGRYVGKTHIDPNITDDTLEVSLGRDQGVVVDREKVMDKTSSQIIGGNKILEMGIDIKLKNKRGKAIQIRVKDQLPISSRGDVEVTLEKKKGAEYEEKNGILKWREKLGPDESKTLHFSYKVKYPKELDPIGL